jgi:hypothetical protein
LDGRPASEVFSGAGTSRLRIGQTYFFDDIEGGIVATVESVTASKSERKAYLVVRTQDDRRFMLPNDLSDAELQDYEKYGDAYFGEPKIRHHESKDITEFYEWLVESYSKTPRERLLELADGHPEIERLRTLNRDDITLELCEAWAGAVDSRKRGTP